MGEFKSIEMFKRIYNIYNKLLSEVAKENNLTLNQLQILMFLKKNKENNIAKNIVENIGATKSHVSMSLSVLESDGYIIKSQDENDKKISHLHLTEKSQKIINNAKKVQKQIKQIMYDGISKEEFALLASVSKKIKDNIEKYEQK